ncbi:MAG: LysR family transcriptional regulator [Anaerovoracaceae bacterium]
METARCKAFLAAVETGSFSKAAGVLNYTPSGVSQLVSALEKDMGFPLLTRNKKGVAVTENGKKMIPAIRNFILQEERIYQISSEINGLVSGEVTIAAYSSIAAHWLAGVIKDFQEDYPQVNIRLREGIRQEVIKWIDEKAADAGFLSYKEDMEYHWIPLAKDEMVAVFPKNHQCAFRESYDIMDCENEDFIMPALGHDDDVTELFNKYKLNPNIKFSTLENFAAMSMIEKGLGMSIMNELIMRNWQCDVVKLPLNPPQHIVLGIALPSWYNASPAAKRFIKYSVERLQQL